MSYRFAGLGLSLSIHAVMLVAVYNWSSSIEDAPTRTDAGQALKLSMSIFDVVKETADIEIASADTQQNANTEKTVAPASSAPAVDKLKAKLEEPKPAMHVVKPPDLIKKIIAETVVSKKVNTESKALPETPKETPTPQSQTTAASQTTATVGKAELDAERIGLENAYKNAVRQAILEQRKYPRQMKRKRVEGTVLIDFQLLRSGAVEGLRVLETSGVKQLDEAALDAVRKVKQFPAYPLTTKKERWGFQIPIVFELN